jgi:outer membrane immunogenic protein
VHPLPCKLINPTVLPYLTGGYSRAYYSHLDFNFANAGGGFSGIESSSFTSNGWFIGRGLETNIYSKWFLKGEFRCASYGEQSVAIKGNVASIAIQNVKMSFNSVVPTFRATLLYKL